MPNTHLSQSKPRRSLAGLLRGSRTRKQARLRHRRLQAERLEDRRLLATISGAVFNDLNADGVKNTGESGQSGWTVYLDADGNGQLGTGETSAITAADGSYSFNGLVEGTYTVAEVQQPGWQQTVPGVERVSVAADGTQGNNGAGSANFSADGRYVVFYSGATNLVPGDTNGSTDVFVHDRQTNTVERVSIAADGMQGNAESMGGLLSADGRYVVFNSLASNLVPGDTNGTRDIFVFDRLARTLECVSLTADGTTGNGQSDGGRISADGRYVVFNSLASNLVPGDTNGTYDVFVYDRETPLIERVSVASDGAEGNGGSLNPPKISNDGRYVAFQSFASNLVSGDTNGKSDAFVYDRQIDLIQRVSVTSDGTQGNSDSGAASISADGRYVGFNSNASNLVSGDTNGFGDAFVTANPFAWASGTHVVALADGQDVSGIDFGNASPTKFYVVNDATQNFTYEYTYSGQLNEAYNLNTGNTAPRGAASTIAGDKTWVVDANRNVYVYGNSGGLLGSWTAGSLNTKAVVEGIATNGTDVWIVDANSDKVYKYAGAASRLTGSQNAASSFSLNSANTSPKDIVTNGVNLWVVNDSTTDKVFKYTVAGALVNSWTITTAGATSPTGITIDPTNVSNIWIVDSGTDRVYQYNAAATFANNSSHAADVAFALAVGNTNPQGIADPPAPGSLVTTDASVLAESASEEAAPGNNDATLVSMCDAPVKMLRIDTVQRSESRDVEVTARDFSYAVGASALAEPVAHRIVDDNRFANDKHHTEVDDLFAQWDGDPLELLSLRDLGM